MEVAFQQDFMMILMSWQIEELKLYGYLIHISLDIIFNGDFMLTIQVDRVSMFVLENLYLFGPNWLIIKREEVVDLALSVERRL